MKRKKQSQQKSQKNKDDHLTLRDYLDQEALLKLKDKKKEWKKEEKKRREEEENKKREERRQREKNKTFEELLNESDLDWKNFK